MKNKVCWCCGGTGKAFNAVDAEWGVCLYCCGIGYDRTKALNEETRRLFPYRSSTKFINMYSPTTEEIKYLLHGYSWGEYFDWNYNRYPWYWGA